MLERLPLEEVALGPKPLTPVSASLKERVLPDGSMNG
jgi:hypothetical protein